MKELILGCGSRIKSKTLSVTGSLEYKNPTTLDNNKDHSPDVLWDLTKHPLPFKDNEFDEIHCYEVLEHLAYQGDYEFFFREFSEYARILKTGGYFIASVPSVSSKWMWGEPSHRRVINSETLVFLNQDAYNQVGKTTMSDFRYIYKADFKSVYQKESEDTFYFILEVRK